MKRITIISLFFVAATMLHPINANAQWTTPATGVLSTINNVAIGTATPAPNFKLTAEGNGIITKNSTTDNALYMWVGTPNPQAMLQVTNYANTLTKPLAINPWGGSVGVGTASPLPNFKLTIEGDGMYARNAAYDNGIYIYPSFAASTIQAVNYVNNVGKRLSLNPYGGGVSVGNVASFPAGYQLYVQTGILAEKVRVAVNGSAQWADYVFAKDYQLMPLAEVEQYIKTNNHLPNMPSATDMVNEGNDLGKTTAKLLEKIEELTLYMIALKKENEAMKKQGESQQQEIERLKYKSNAIQ